MLEYRLQRAVAARPGSPMAGAMREAGARRSFPLRYVHADSLFKNAPEAKFLISLLASIWDLTEARNAPFKTVGEIS